MIDWVADQSVPRSPSCLLCPCSVIHHQLSSSTASCQPTTHIFSTDWEMSYWYWDVDWLHGSLSWRQRRATRSPAPCRWLVQSPLCPLVRNCLRCRLFFRFSSESLTLSTLIGCWLQSNCKSDRRYTVALAVRLSHLAWWSRWDWAASWSCTECSLLCDPGQGRQSEHAH